MSEQADLITTLRGLVKSEMMDMNTSINAEIVSYSNGLATVRPLHKKQFPDGDILPFPNIDRVPLRWPSFNGGQCGIKGPVTPGDKVLLVFSQQAIDGTDDARRFDLSDAYAIPIDNLTTAQGGNNADMIMYFGAAYIKLTADGALEINAPAGTKTIAPTNEYTGAVTVKGIFTFMAGMVGSTTSGIATTINGAINFLGTLTSNGKNISDSHIHANSGGSGNGGPVV